jgi:hypothetical protein
MAALVAAVITQLRLLVALAIPHQQHHHKVITVGKAHHLLVEQIMALVVVELERQEEMQADQLQAMEAMVLPLALAVLQ